MTAVYATFIHVAVPDPWTLLWCPQCPPLVYVHTVPVWHT